MVDDLTPVRRLDRAALDRVLARAAELQTGAVDASDGGSLTEAEIVELGREAGMSPEHLRQAIAEERTRSVVPNERGIAATIVGPARVQASRTVIGRPAELLDVMDMWMQRQEGLQLKRRVTDRIIWETRRDIVASIQRGLNLGGRGFPLTRAGEVSATVSRVDDTRTLVALDAGLADHRSALMNTVGAVSATGVGATVIGAVIGIMLPVAIIPALILPTLAISTSRQAQARAVTRGQLALDQLLDHLERGDHRRPGGLLAAITATLQGR